MNQYCDSNDSTSRLVSQIETVLKLYPVSGTPIGISRSPGVVDVMGGISEDSGGLLLTATVALSFHVAAWKTADRHIRIVYFDSENDPPNRNFSLPAQHMDNGRNTSEIIDACREKDAAWAVPCLLTLHQALIHKAVPLFPEGLCLLIQTDFPKDADFCRHSVLASATIDAVFKAMGIDIDRLTQSRICADAIKQLTDLYQVRHPMTALCAPDAGALLQLRFVPHQVCEPLELLPGIIVKTITTPLSRPVLQQRLIHTRLCSEMGHRMIMDLQRQDGRNPDPATSRLSSITPTEFVERYRDRMPSKITRQKFLDKFGSLRGLQDGDDDPKNIYKIRSRAEHHIYENRRVHDFVNNIIRARRNNDLGALKAAGDLMYASHWSHSQRCGIGGVESDRLVNCIRHQGPQAGLFGAKVTAGGQGGELVILMRDDQQARAALTDAVAQAEAASQHSVRIFEGALPGAQSFVAPDLADTLDSAGVA